jgi:hypothetical protein
MGTVKADMRQEIRDAKGEIQNELNEKTSAFLSAEEDGIYINYINKNKENV